MSASSAPYLTGDSLLSYLREVFPGRQVITATEFREFLNIAPSTDLRMRNLGKYPRTISLPGVMRDPRILIIDLAVWLEQGGCPETEGVTYKKRGRGSAAWKKNHSPKARTSSKPAQETSSAIPPEPNPDTVPDLSADVAPEAVAEAAPETAPGTATEPPSKAAPEAAADSVSEEAPEA